MCIDSLQQTCLVGNNCFTFQLRLVDCTCRLERFERIYFFFGVFFPHCCTLTEEAENFFKYEEPNPDSVSTIHGCIDEAVVGLLCQGIYKISQLLVTFNSPESPQQ